MKTRVLFLQFTVSNPAHDSEYWKKLGMNSFEYFYAEPGAAWVAQSIVDFADTQVIDCDFLTDDQVLNAIVQFGPGVVGFSCFTAGWPRAKRIAVQLNQSVTKIFGGWHISQPGIADKMLGEFPSSIVVTGRGEGMTDVFRSPENYRGQILNGNKKPGQRCYPFSIETRQPFFTLFGVPADQKTATLVLRGGCTFGCSYCPSAKTGLAPIRSVEEVIEEILRLVREHGINFIFIRDEDPFLPQYRPWLAQFCEALISTGLNTKVGFHSFGDARLTDTDFVRVLVKAGWTGVDCGVEHITVEGRQILGRKQDWDKTLKAFQVMREAGLFTTANIIIWSPGDTLETCDLTLAGLKELQPDEALPMFFTPLPGLANGKFENLPRRTDRWEDFHFLKPILLNDCAVTDEELIKRRRLLMRDYYSSREYAALMRFRQQQCGEEKFKYLTAIRRERFSKYGIDIWNP